MLRARVLTIAIIVLGLSARPASAGFVVRPSSVAIGAASGQLLRLAISLRNDNTAALEVALSLLDVKQDSPTSIEYPVAGTTSYSAATLLKVPTEALTIQPRVERKIEITGKIPIGARGTRHCVLAIIPRVAPVTGSGAVAALSVRVLVPIDIQIAGPENSQLEIAKLHLGLAKDVLAGYGWRPDDIARYDGRLATEVVLKTDSEAAARASGWLYLRDRATNRIVVKMPLTKNDAGVRVLPNSMLGMALPLGQAVPAGEYTLQCVLQHGRTRRKAEATAAFRVTSTGVELLGQADSVSERLNLTAAPSTLEIPIVRDQTTTRTVVVRNAERVPLHCAVTSTGFSEELDGSVVEVPSETADEIVPDAAQFDLPPGGTRSVRLAVTNRGDLDAKREHYWLVRVVGRAAGDEAVKSVGIATVAVVAADRRQREPADIKLETVGANPALESTMLRLRLTNPGGCLAEIKGSLTIYEAEEKRPLAVVPVGDKEPLHVLAGTARQVSVEVPVPMGTSEWRCELMLNLPNGKQSLTRFKILPPAPAGTKPDGAPPVGPLAPTPAPGK